MPIQVLMPALSPTMTEGNLVKWLKKEGEAIDSGDIMAEIETDKATMEVEAVDEGVLGRILVAEGTEGVPVNTPIAILLKEGEDAADLGSAVAPAPPPPSADPIPVAAAPAPSSPPPVAGIRVFASPLARRMAQQAGLDLGAIAGSGPHGRVVKRDIDASLESGTAVSAPPPRPAAPSPSASPDAPFEEVANSSMRKVIAQRLGEAKRTIPHFYLSMDSRLDALLALRKDLNGRAPEGAGSYKLSVNDFVVRAVALALRKIPAANASWSDDAIRIYRTIDVSVAV